MKKRVFVFATCHAGRLQEILNLSKTFTKHFEIEAQKNFLSPGKPVDITKVLDKIDECDVFLYHKTAQLIKALPNIQSQEKAIPIPYITNRVYWPSYNFTGVVNPLLVEPPYHWGLISWRCTILDKLFASGLPQSQIVQAYTRMDLSENLDLQAIYESQIAYFRGLDEVGKIMISNWLIDRLLNENLFHIYNHPASRVFCEMGRQILERIGIKNDLPQDETEDRFSVVQSPIHPSVVKALNIRFYQHDREYRLGPHRVNFEGYLNLYLDALGTTAPAVEPKEAGC